MFKKKVFGPVHEGKNVIVASLTGSGKTLSFVLPIVQKAIDKGRLKHTTPFCMVIAPTRELAIQVGKVFSDTSAKDLQVRTVLVYGGVSIDEQIYKLKAGCDVIVGTPGRIIDMIERGVLDLSNIRTVVLDEADKMLSMGFQEPIEDIFKKIYEKRPKTQVCLFSATIESWVKQVASTIMQNVPAVFVDLVKDLAGRTPKTATHLAVNCLKSDRVTTIADLILCYGGKNKATIVFVNTKRECNDLMISDKIKQEVQIIHGDINQKQREATINGFKSGKFKCLVATDVASRGLDLPMVDLVIQSEPPKELDTYIHRAGRTARAGRTGTCITLYTRMTEGLILRIENKIKIKLTRIGAPQKNDIITSSIRDIKTAISDIDPSMINLFHSSAEKLIEEYGAEQAISRLFAYVSGHTAKMASRSLLSGAEGFISYTIKFTQVFNHAGYIWGFLKRLLPETLKGKIRGMRTTKTLDGCVFDYPEEGHKEFEELFFKDKLYGINYTLEKSDKLPELQDDTTQQRGGYSGGQPMYNGGRTGGYGNGGGYANGNGGHSAPRSYSAPRTGGGASREGRLDIFVGNMPYNTDETVFRQWLSKSGVAEKDIEVRFAMDKETNQQKGFAFCSVYDQEKSNKIVALNGQNFNGKPLRINEGKK